VFLATEPIGSRFHRIGWGCVTGRLGLRLNEHIEANGPTVFAHAFKMDLEGIVSKRKGSPYRGGRSLDWLKMKNPAAPAVKLRQKGNLSSGRDWMVWRRRQGTLNAIQRCVPAKSGCG
jgi:hypothetical protein